MDVSQAYATKKLLGASLKALMREKPFQKITVEDILERAEVSRRTFYRHFPDKYALLGWIYNDEFCQYVEVRPDKTIWDYYPDICRHLYNDRAFFAKAFAFGGQNSFRDFCIGKLHPLIMNDFGPVFPNEQIAHFVVDRYMNACFDGYVWWLSQEPCMPPDEYMRFSREIIRQTALGVDRSFELQQKNK